ncbi:hypothetical protein EXIGLDRAFT_832425 [Exidia glandulosa HHB12029]|uniref:Transferase-domain-containing protein n=1 Tax=Exidia glandulosa HHB12029 TaxID=1314781 RepID=A0A165LQ52_EXIGL|nr:hypothetical protein EXIGLDRAFT_832425 [Exidia glandulosa HHB12029]
MFSWLDWRKKAPESPPLGVDTVVCSASDLSSKDVTLTYCFVIPAPLDVDKLKAGLFAAIEQKLPRCGARLARRNGLYEFQIPRQFTQEVPAAGFTHVHKSQPFAGTPLPPNVGDVEQPCMVDMPNCASLFRASGTPGHLDDFLVPGTPLLHVHVTTFEDATLIGLTASHVLWDAHGLRTLLSAWTAALEGELDSVEGSAVDFNPFQTIYQSVTPRNLPPGEPVRGWYNLGTFGTLHFIVRFVWRLFREPKETARLFYIPKPWLAAQKEACMAELAARGSKEWVGSSDVLIATFCKVLHAHRTDSTPVHIHNPVNVRRLLPTYFTQPFLNNAVTLASAVPIPAAQLGSQPVVDTALEIRRAVNAYVVNTDVLLQELAWSNAAAGVGRTLFPCRPGGDFAAVSNWRSAKFNEVDWSGARVDWEKNKGAACATFVTAYAQDNPRIPLRGGGSVCSETEDAIWMSVGRSDVDWEKIRKNGNVRFA